MKQPKQQQPQVSVDFSQATDIVCDECGHNKFSVVYLLKSFSALISPSGQETVVPVQAFACAECGHVNKDFLPDEE